MEFDTIDQDVQRLAQNKKRWTEIALSKKVELLEQILVSIEAVSAEQVKASAHAKGLTDHANQIGEEWLGGPLIQAKVTRQLLVALRTFDQQGHTGVQTHHAHSKAWGQVAVKVFPHSLIDKLSLQGFTAEIWLDPQEQLDSWQQKTAAGTRSVATSTAWTQRGANSSGHRAAQCVPTRIVFAIC